MYDGLSELSDLSLHLQDRGLSVSTANSCIERTIHIFHSINKSVPKMNTAEIWLFS